jgi:lipoprotein LprG
MNLRPLAAVLVPLLIALTSCGDDGGKGDGAPDDVLATAKKTLDDTSGVHLVLETPEMPKGVSGVTKADGIANHQPAFEGSIDLVYSGIEATVKLTAVDGLVYAVLPFTTKYNEVDPKDYNAPDPAALMATEGGISSWLTEATDVQKGEQTRDGNDVLTTYTGTLAGSAVVSAIPSANEKSEFDATFTIDDEGKLRTASVTGEFYKGDPELTYDVTFTEYGTEKEITKP